MSRWLAAFLTLALSRPALAAHCACGGETFPGAAVSAETVGIGSVAISTGFAYSQFELLSQGDFESRARASYGKRHEGPSAMAAGSLGVSWGLGQRLQLSLNQSWQRMSEYREGFVNDSGAFEFYDHGALSGLKDLGLSLKGRFLETPWGHLALQGEVALPSGQQVQGPHIVADAGGNSLISRARELPGWVQPSRGAWDGALTGIYSLVLGDFLMDLSYSYSLPVSSGDYLVGLRQSLSIALGMKLWDHHLAYFDWISVHGKQDHYRGNKVWATGGIFDGAGVRTAHPLTDRTQFSMQLMFPMRYETAGQEGTRMKLQGSARLTTLF